MSIVDQGEVKQENSYFSTFTTVGASNDSHLQRRSLQLNRKKLTFHVCSPRLVLHWIKLIFKGQLESYMIHSNINRFYMYVFIHKQTSSFHLG